jgi:hypothetical protein
MQAEGKCEHKQDGAYSFPRAAETKPGKLKTTEIYSLTVQRLEV